MKRIIALIIAGCLMLIASTGISYAAGTSTAYTYAKNEIVGYYSETAVNSYTDAVSSSYSIAIRHQLTHGFATSVAYVNEGHPLDFPKVDGFAAELWYRIPFGGVENHLRVTIGAGPYLTFSTMKAQNKSGYKDEHRIDLLAGVDIRYDVSKHWAFHAIFRRAWTADKIKDSDVDIFGVGIGYRL